MKSILTLISLIFLVSQVDAQKYNRKHFEQYPDCAEVIQHFYENNHDALKLPRGRYWFEKRQDGWYACLHDDYNRYGKASKEQMVWDAKAKKYLEEDNQALTVSNQQYLAGIIREYHLFEYKIWPVCGYRNAATDVIKLLSPVKKLTDNELEALARAYNKVSGYLIEYNTLKTSVYDSTLNKNTFSSEVLTEYVSMAKKVWLTTKNSLNKILLIAQLLDI
ncbi:MAG: hypothetical protein GY810_05055 [Aureispira sp.]|nr:hypothetical protein [Aureispira sp.]